MKNWIPCTPADRGSMAMMRFILETSQGVKSYTHLRIVIGDRRGSVKPVNKLMNEWLNEYVRQHRIVEDVPRFAMRDAMQEVLTNGTRPPPDERLDWEGFSVEPRKGWRKEREETTAMTWEQYLSNKGKREAKEGDKRTVKPDIAVRNLMERGQVSFRWGTVQLRGPYEDKLTVQAARRGIAKEDFLRRVTQIDFMRVKEDKDNWKVNFVLE